MQNDEFCGTHFLRVSCRTSENAISRNRMKTLDGWRADVPESTESGSEGLPKGVSHDLRSTIELLKALFIRFLHASGDEGPAP
jgi:hypothetical protein